MAKSRWRMANGGGRRSENRSDEGSGNGGQKAGDGDKTTGLQDYWTAGPEDSGLNL